jgi:hypothetical protein
MLDRAIRSVDARGESFATFAAAFPEVAAVCVSEDTYGDSYGSAAPLRGLGLCRFRSGEKPVLLRGSRERMYYRADLAPTLMDRLLRRLIAQDRYTIVSKEGARAYGQDLFLRLKKRPLKIWTARDSLAWRTRIARVLSDATTALPFGVEDVFDLLACGPRGAHRIIVLVEGQIQTIRIPGDRTHAAAVAAVRKYLQVLINAEKAFIARIAERERAIWRGVALCVQQAEAEKVVAEKSRIAEKLAGFEARHGIALPIAVRRLDEQQVSAYLKGMEGRWRGVPKIECPYSAGRPTVSAWRKGWAYGAVQLPGHRARKVDSLIAKYEQRHGIVLPPDLRARDGVAVGVFVRGAAARWKGAKQSKCPYAAQSGGGRRGSTHRRTWLQGWRWGGSHASSPPTGAAKPKAQHADSPGLRRR